MSSSTTDLSPRHNLADTDAASHAAEDTAANHDLPARSGAEDDAEPNTETDDAATMAASEELKHTSISDRVNLSSQKDGTEAGRAPGEGDKEMSEHNVRSSTPENDELKDRLSSPKKKRGRDFEDDARDMGEGEAGENGTATAGGVASASRTSRSEPEKKRPRDTSEETKAAAKESDGSKVSFEF